MRPSEFESRARALREAMVRGARGIVRGSVVFAVLVIPKSCGQNPDIGPLSKVNHVIVVMQENHSFDNYFGALAYAPGSPYRNGNGPCPRDDHLCVDGLTCRRDSGGALTCANSNLDDDGSRVAAFHDSDYCPSPDLDHGWTSVHSEADFSNPNGVLRSSPNDGFVRVNDATEQNDNGVESATEDDTMGFYNETDLPFYYALAQSFAIDDRYFCSMLGPTVPNRFYLMAATSFGHVLTVPDLFPPPGGYQPITGTIFDLLDANNVSWADYFSDIPQGGAFRDTSSPQFKDISTFFSDAAAGTLPSVSFVDPELTTFSNLATDEHPPHDIRAGQFYVSQVVSAVRNGPDWKDSIIFITYDEHGGFYDHVAPPPAVQGGALTPDEIAPGLCEDLSQPPASLRPGGGANCSDSLSEAEALCPSLATAMQALPGGAYPASCATFNQLGIRVPFIAVSPFAKPHYVSHTVGDHTSILALIEKRFLNSAHLTARDAGASTLEDLFDFDHSPSLDADVPASLAQPPDLTTDGNRSCASS